ncbi:MAG TPA: alanine--tRNA ligase, partial [Chthoniobacterales bacterium]|nr:alanine--tRNA ligase [Chthoniobacterales bacterium]
MTSAQIRQSFLDFFREKKHTIVSSSSLLPDAPNLLFTNAGMNQFVPIFLGQQKPSWNPPRVADTQKCIRAGGKHNDLEDVGLDTYHHTFFEMLGNWSFGDYFKKEAIECAWELVVERWGLPPQRLYATVYKPGPGEPSEFDQEAHDHWARLFQEADLDPKIHIVNGAKADNFWMMGDTGPCGPCSELHVDLTPDGDMRGALVNKDDPRCIEIWNLVFIQFNADAAGNFTPLPQRHVDTGLGFERSTAVIQGTKNFTEFSGTVSNYETDIFRPIFDEIEKLSGKNYASTLPGSAPVSGASAGVSPAENAARDTQQSDRDGRSTQIQIDIAFRVIADHIRALTFAIADGIIPSNEGRGYVLRRILRRAVRYGRALDFHEPFFFKLVDIVAQTMGDVFPEVRAKQSKIKETIKREEEAFNKTLDKGIELFERSVEELSKFRHIFSARKYFASDQWALSEEDIHMLRADEAPLFDEIALLILEKIGRIPQEDITFLRKNPGAIPANLVRLRSRSEWASAAFDVLNVFPAFEAFRLYDTYGFPLDLTELMARERGFTVDVAGFENLMEQQRSRGRAAQKTARIEAVDAFVASLDPTEFTGYDQVQTRAELQVISEERNILVAKASPFYAEMGGQVADTGTVQWIGKDERRYGNLKIANVQRSSNDVIIHKFSGDTELSWSRDAENPDFVELKID